VGITFGTIIILAHLCRLESFGSPYFAPWAPFGLKDMKDTFIRLPITKFNTRPLDPKPNTIDRQSVARGWKFNEKKQK
jgi:spore germination protein KA